MMNVLYVCLAITLCQGIQGFEGVDYQFEDGEVEVSPRFSELMTAETQLLSVNEHCDNVSDTLEQMYRLGLEVIMWVNQSADVLVKDVCDLYQCYGLGAVSCVLDNLLKAKEDLLTLKPAFDEYTHDFTVMVLLLKKEFPLCLH